MLYNSRVICNELYMTSYLWRVIDENKDLTCGFCCFSNSQIKQLESIRPYRHKSVFAGYLDHTISVLEFDFWTKPVTYQIQSNLCTTNILGTLNLWPLMTGGRLSEGALCYKNQKLGPQNGGRCRQVVAIRRRSLTQVLLYFIFSVF